MPPTRGTGTCTQFLYIHGVFFNQFSYTQLAYFNKLSSSRDYATHSEILTISNFFYSLISVLAFAVRAYQNLFCKVYSHFILLMAL